MPFLDLRRTDRRPFQVVSRARPRPQWPARRSDGSTLSRRSADSTPTQCGAVIAAGFSAQLGDRHYAQVPPPQLLLAGHRGDRRVLFSPLAYGAWPGAGFTTSPQHRSRRAPLRLPLFLMFSLTIVCLCACSRRSHRQASGRAMSMRRPGRESPFLRIGGGAGVWPGFTQGSEIGSASLPRSDVLGWAIPA